MAASSDMKDRKDIPAGTKISCTTFNGVTHEGEVLAFDNNSKFLVIKTKVVKRESEVKIINLSQVTQLSIKEEAKNPPPAIVPLDMHKIRDRYQRECDDKQSEFDAVGKGVSYEGRQLFRFIKKTYKCCWKHDKIKCTDVDVTINPPYKAENLEGKDTAVECVRKVIHKYYSEQGDGSKK